MYLSNNKRKNDYVKIFLIAIYMIPILKHLIHIVIDIGISLLDTLIGFGCLFHAHTNTTLSLDEILDVGWGSSR